MKTTHMTAGNLTLPERMELKARGYEMALRKACRELGLTFVGNTYDGFFSNCRMTVETPAGDRVTIPYAIYRIGKRGAPGGTFRIVFGEVDHK